MPNPMLSYWYRLYTKQTKQEKAVEKELCKLGVRYRTQHIVLAAKAILDFYLPDQNLCIEVDDISHNRKQKKDQERTNRLTGLGIKVVRFTNADVDSKLKNVIGKIREEIGKNNLPSI